MLPLPHTDFEILDTKVYNHPLVYLDNAATTQKPRCVVDAISHYYTHLNSNIHRGAHYLAAQATELYELTRRKVAQFIGAAKPCEIIFTRGTTESINLVAASFSQMALREGDEIIVTAMEHHSNLVPWQLAAEHHKAVLRFVPYSDEGVLDIEAYRQLFTPRTRLVAATHVSNTLGTVNPVADMARIAHSHGVPMLVDGAQAVAHTPIDVQALGCDFYCFSAHKMYGPMGIGVLYGKEELLNAMPPYHGGGEMIADVKLERSTYNVLPFKFEAGTPSVADVLGFGAAVDYLQAIGMAAIASYEEELLHYATERLLAVDDLRIIGRAPHKASVISFLIGNAHPYDTGLLLDKLGIAVRTGHHCTQPVMDRYGIPGTVRASFAAYTTTADIDALASALIRIAPMLQ